MNWISLISFVGKKCKSEYFASGHTGIEAHTHDYILTGQEDSKFGFDLNSGQAKHALDTALSSSFNVLGIHCHIGSQIFETTGFLLAIDKLFTHITQWKEEFQYEPTVRMSAGIWHSLY